MIDFYNIAATLVGIGGLALAIDQSVRKRSAEKELNDIISRGSAPYLLADHMNVRVNGESSGNQIFHTGQDTLGKITDGEIITLNLINHGEEARGVGHNWEQGSGIRTYGGKIICNDTSAAQITYRYDLKKHGQNETIAISFETFNGLKLTHTYELIHGVCSLKRIDPK